jgi:hypothetical protein
MDRHPPKCTYIIDMNNIIMCIVKMEVFDGGFCTDIQKIEYTEVRNFAQGEEEWASHRDSATMDVA